MQYWGLLRDLMLSYHLHHDVQKTGLIGVGCKLESIDMRGH